MNALDALRYVASVDGFYKVFSIPAYEVAKLAHKRNFEPVAKFFPAASAMKDVVEATQAVLLVILLGTRFNKSSNPSEAAKQKNVWEHIKAVSYNDISSIVNVSIDFLFLANVFNKVGSLAVRYIVVLKDTKVARALTILRPLDNVFFLFVFGKFAYDEAHALYENYNAKEFPKESLFYTNAVAAKRLEGHDGLKPKHDTKIKENRKRLIKLILDTSVMGIGAISFGAMAFASVAAKSDFVIDKLDTVVDLLSVMV